MEDLTQYGLGGLVVMWIVREVLPVYFRRKSGTTSPPPAGDLRETGAHPRVASAEALGEVAKGLATLEGQHPLTGEEVRQWRDRDLHTHDLHNRFDDDNTPLWWSTKTTKAVSELAEQTKRTAINFEKTLEVQVHSSRLLEQIVESQERCDQRLSRVETDIQVIKRATA